jgi:hypothetical protein
LPCLVYQIKRARLARDPTPLLLLLLAPAATETNREGPAARATYLCQLDAHLMEVPDVEITSGADG